MFGLGVQKVVLSMLTKLRRDSTLEDDVKKQLMFCPLGFCPLRFRHAFFSCK